MFLQLHLPQALRASFKRFVSELTMTTFSFQAHAHVPYFVCFLFVFFVSGWSLFKTDPLVCFSADVRFATEKPNGASCRDDKTTAGSLFDERAIGWRAAPCD